jgi:hypothetical protein
MSREHSGNFSVTFRKLSKSRNFRRIYFPERSRKLPETIKKTSQKTIEETSQKRSRSFPVKLRKLRKIDETSQKDRGNSSQKNDRGNFERLIKLPKNDQGNSSQKMIEETSQKTIEETSQKNFPETIIRGTLMCLVVGK